MEFGQILSFSFFIWKWGTCHLAVWLKLNAPFLIRELERGSPGSFLWFRTLICKGSYSQATMDTFLTPWSLHMWRWSWAPKRCCSHEQEWEGLTQNPAAQMPTHHRWGQLSVPPQVKDVSRLPWKLGSDSPPAAPPPGWDLLLQVASACLLYAL